MDPYPNVKDVNSVKIISYREDNRFTFFVFGGYVNNEVTNDILCFEDEVWSKVGTLTSIRTKFSVILNNDKVYVIGGKTTQKYEVCTLSSTVHCKQDSSIDFQASEEPTLFGVSTDGSCDLVFSNFEPNETKELMILSNSTFIEIDHFVPVQKTNFRKDKIHFVKMRLRLLWIFFFYLMLLSPRIL